MKDTLNSTYLMKKGYKAYFITRHLLTRFNEKNDGFCFYSDLAEKELFEYVTKLLLGKVKKSWFIEYVDCDFGLEKIDVDKAFSDFIDVLNQLKGGK